MKEMIHVVDIKEFLNNYGHFCLYKGNDYSKINIIELRPKSFHLIRQHFKVMDEELFESFAPINNKQAINNFFTGAGKSNSFFLFTDDKRFVLKTLKVTEFELLFT